MFGIGTLGTERAQQAGTRLLRRFAVGLLATGLFAALSGSAAATASAETTTSPTLDLSGPAFQILAPGDFGGLPPNENYEHAYDQGLLYDKLTPLGGDVTAQNLEEDFLSEKFGVTGPVVREEHPEPGLVIKRDKNDIPHVYGQTRDEVMFGSGYIAAEDRGLILALGLGPAYAAALEIPGINPFELLLTGRSFTPSPQAYEYVAEQKKSLFEKGPEGEQVYKDLEDWADGVNAYEDTQGEARLLPPLTATDAIAGFAFIGSIFGNGGGNEVTNSNFLAGLEAKLGQNEGLKVFRDLKEVNDPEAPTTTSKPFPYDGVPTGPTPGAAVIDRGSDPPSSPVAQAMSAARASKRKISNFLLAGPEHSANGHATSPGASRAPAARTSSSFSRSCANRAAARRPEARPTTNTTESASRSNRSTPVCWAPPKPKRRASSRSWKACTVRSAEP